MSAHTPGPWEIAVLRADLDPVEQFREMLAHGTGPIWAVWCPEHPLSRGQHPRPEHAVLSATVGNGPASEANAHLIAAAPELFAALIEQVEEFDKRLREYVSVGNDAIAMIAEQHHGKRMDRARAAIAKARGGK